jgi:hypothetical protein
VIAGDMGKRIDALPFSPIGFTDDGQKLSKRAYEEIRDKATKNELNKLMNSEQFARWNKRKQCEGRVKLEYLLGGIGLLILSSLFAPKLWASNSHTLDTNRAINQTFVIAIFCDLPSFHLVSKYEKM